MFTSSWNSLAYFRISKQVSGKHPLYCSPTQGRQIERQHFLMDCFCVHIILKYFKLYISPPIHTHINTRYTYISCPTLCVCVCVYLGPPYMCLFFCFNYSVLFFYFVLVSGIQHSSQRNHTVYKLFPLIFPVSTWHHTELAQYY